MRLHGVSISGDIWVKIHGNEREREEVVTVVDNERCDGGGSLLSETSTAMSSIWYHFHTAILPFLLQLTLKSTLSPSEASRF